MWKIYTCKDKFVIICDINYFEIKINSLLSRIYIVFYGVFIANNF